MQTLVFLLLVAVINVVVCQECPQDWLHFEGNCYGYGDTAVYWGIAQAICQSRGARLAEIPTLAVNDALTTLASDKMDNCVWLAGSDMFHEGDWEWSSGRYDFKNFTNWHSGEPNNWDNDEDCLNMYQPQKHNWNDAPCNLNCNFICEAPASGRR